jgi:protein N-terminal methyltransferase
MNKGPTKQNGCDSEGYFYSDIDEMWKRELEPSKYDANTAGSKGDWYNKGAEYWEKTEATISGVLGGFPELNTPDIKASKKLLAYFFEKANLQNDRAIDCGAGIGRIAKELLVYCFKEVDLVEQNPVYVEEAKKIMKDVPNMKDYYAEGLQNFVPTKNYDCFWIQWVSSHLTDDDYVAFLCRCADHSTEKGIIVVKENIARGGFVVDKEDYSVTRSDEMYRTLFAKAKLRVVMQEWQTEFPEDLFRVNQYVLRR